MYENTGWKCPESWSREGTKGGDLMVVAQLEKNGAEEVGQRQESEDRGPRILYTCVSVDQ
jgi:hypothetical protein